MSGISIVQPPRKAGPPGTQGPPGTPAVVNGKSGETITLDAEDVEAVPAAAVGQPSGVAPLDDGNRLLPAHYAIHPGQVLDAAAAAFGTIPGAIWGQFLSNITDPSAGDGTYTAAYVYPVAPPNGRLWGMLKAYLMTPLGDGPGLTANAANTQLTLIWAAAAAISP